MTASRRLWKTRAKELAVQRPYASDILNFYQHVLDAQDTVRNETQTDDFGVLQRASSPQLRIATLPANSLAEGFFDFVTTLKEHAPILTAKVGDAILAARSHGVLDWYLSDTDQIPEGFEEHTPERLEFYPRAFLQAVMQRIGAPIDAEKTEAHLSACPFCGEAPILSLLRDEPSALGERRLMCSLCCSSWRFPRITCPQCGESSSEKLIRHEVDGSHVSIEACTTCRHYIKSIDQRKDGRAQPIVDEIATVELDLWAKERGLSKVRNNVLGF